MGRSFLSGGGEEDPVPYRDHFPFPHRLKRHDTPKLWLTKAEGGGRAIRLMICSLPWTLESPEKF